MTPEEFRAKQARDNVILHAGSAISGSIWAGVAVWCALTGHPIWAALTASALVFLVMRLLVEIVEK